MQGSSAEAQQQALANGSVLDSFQIDKVLGVGGFGVTYAANDTSLQRRVAIKEYFPSGLALRATDGATLTARTSDHNHDYNYGLQRFLDEARTLARFRHPNIVHVFRYLEANGTAYLVMEFEEGEPLESYLSRTKRLPEELILRWVIPILHGLVSVHEQSYLHRDIKPGNIFLRFSGDPLLLDFGSARLALEQQREAMTVVLTPGYAPIEQYASDKQGPWTDLYAIGATMYRMMYGKSPPEATRRLSELHNGHPDPAERGYTAASRKYSQAFVAAVKWMMQPRASDRPQTAPEVLAVLDPISNTPSAAPVKADVRSEASPAKHHAKTVQLATSPKTALMLSQVEDIEAVLTEYLGPIARLLVKTALKETQDRESLIALLGEEIEDDNERAEFHARVKNTQ